MRQRLLYAFWPLTIFYRTNAKKRLEKLYMAAWSEAEIERTLEELKKRTLTDPEFRELALSDSVSAIASINPKPMPDGYQVRFIDNSGPIKNFLLPDAIVESEELSDAELEAVAGGAGTRAPGGLDQNGC